MTFRFPPTQRVIAEGQSLATTTSGGAGGRWIDHLIRGRGSVGPPISIAVDGQSWTALGPTLTTRLTPYLVPSVTRLVFILCGGQGDLVEGDDAATIYSDMGAHADDLRTAGAAAGRTVRVIAQTIPRNSLSNPGTIRPAANALILADASSKFDYEVDVDVAPLQDPLDTTYYVDQLHWTSTACAIVAGLVAPSLDLALA